MNAHRFFLFSLTAFLGIGSWSTSAQESENPPSNLDAIIQSVLDAARVPLEEAQPDVAPDTQHGDRWLVILCGLPGDDEYRQRMTDAIEKLFTHAESRLGVTAGHIRLLVGDQSMADSLADTTGTVEIATAESVAALTDQLRGQVTKDDSLWVVMLGHTDLQGRSSRWNVSDADPDQKTFAKWFQPVKCREKVYWITMPLSGFYVRNLSAPGTIVITGTQADLEISATEMPYALADILAGEESVQAAGDRDEDGQTSLLDLYLAVCHEIADRYAAENLLLTEHALIDDNGDRRGTELQQRYLPEERGGKPQMKAVRRASSLDGARAAQILLPDLPMAKPEPEATPEEEAETENEESVDQNDTGEAEVADSNSVASS